MLSAANNRAKEVFNTSKMTFIAVIVITSLISSLVNEIAGRTGFFLLYILAALVEGVVAACSSCFFFRAVNRGTPDTRDLTDILNMKEHYSTIAAIALVNLAILAVPDLLGRLFPDMLLMNFAISLGSFFLSVVFSAVWFLFIANPHYNTAVYFHASLKYIGSHFWGYIGFEFYHIMIILLVGILAVILNIVGVLFFIPFIIMYIPYLTLAVAAYVSQLIPDEWYMGTAQF